MTSTAAKDTLGTAALKLAQTRRSLMTAMSGEAGEVLTLDLMGFHPQHITEGSRDFARLAAATHVDHLRQAELFLADGDMCTLLDTAAASMPDQVLQEEDLLAPSGLLGFLVPLTDRTGVGIELPIVGLSWQLLPGDHPIIARREDNRPALLIFAYASVRDLAAKFDAEPAPGMSRWMPNASVVWTLGTEIGTAWGDAELTDATPYITPGFYQRILAAFWTLARQPKLTTSDDHAVPRPERARYARAGITRPDEPVRLIRLAHRDRDEAGQTPGDGGRTYSVQWAVRGHWRQQWLPSRQAHRQQWIAPYVKGPADKPFKGGERVFLATGRDFAPPARQ